MTDRKFDDVPLIAGDTLADGLFGHGLLSKRAAEFFADAVGHGLDAADLLHRGIEHRCIADGHKVYGIEGFEQCKAAVAAGVVFVQHAA
jgi:hypothetical protein